MKCWLRTLALAASLAVVRHGFSGFPLLSGAREMLRHARRDILVFTCVNFFAYALLNGDFALVRYIGNRATVEAVGSTKILFERCVLPVWLILASAASLQVLRSRHPTGAGAIRVSVSAGAGARIAVSALIAALGSVAGYFIYNRLVLDADRTQSILFVLPAALGYVCNGIAATLLDVFVLRSRVRTVIGFFVAALVLIGIQQAFLIREFGTAGWSGGWLLANGVLAAVLMYQCSRRREPLPQLATGGGG